MVKRVGICVICGKPANFTCMICGATVCGNCMKDGICILCSKGKRL